MKTAENLTDLMELHSYTWQTVIGFVKPDSRFYAICYVIENRK